MLTDYHCHIIPKIDDGSDSVETSLKMLGTMHEQGVERVVSTSHFYAHREKSVEEFLKKRQNAFALVKEQNVPINEIRLGAEVAVEHGISGLANIEKLAIEGTSLILMELPYTSYAEWMPDEIYNLSCEFKLKPIIAHIHRYIEYYSAAEIKNILNLDAVFQVNNEAFANYKERKFVQNLIKEGYPVVFGSDSHNMDSRKPNFDLLMKKIKSKDDLLESSNVVLDKYAL